ncbi:50S ribosomal protein L25/general stress protein Ctc [Dermabacteraceae bacterium P13115]|nr:50S ribosomal protein L25/general stress protein Ctc [Dermabacteraceae bacterium TAE3-ERU5]
MAENLKVEERTEFGKGASRRLRVEGKIPAVLYGHGMEPLHLVLPGHQTALIARNANALVELELPSGEKHVALLKDIQRHPLKRNLAHIDLIAVKRGEKVEVEIPVTIVGEPVSPGVAVVETQLVTVSAEAIHLPEGIEIDVEGKEIGYQLLAGDLPLENGTEMVSDPELLVVSVTEPREEEPEEGEEAEGEAAEESSEEE